MRRTFYSSLLALLGMIAGTPLLAQVKPETIRQIQLLLNEKASRSPAQKKMASQLLQGLRESKGQKMVAGVNLEPAELKRDSRGYIEVDITAAVNNSLLAKIRSTGATVLFASADYNSIRAQIALSAVETIAAYPEVRFIQPAVQSETVGAGMPKASKNNLKTAGLSINKQNGVFSLPKPSQAQRQQRVKEAIKKYLEEHQEYNPMVFQSGTVNSQGDRSHRTDDARNAYGYAGQGIKIGVLSDSYNVLGGAAADVASGDLPGTTNPFGNTTPVTVVQDYTSGSDEGRAMLQIVHDLAPKAQLFFATANVSEAGFANYIVALRNTYGCDIIIDDVGYFDEPAFQDGIVAQAVNTVTAAGALYFSSAANSGSVALGTAGVWEGDFTDVGSPTFTYPSGTKSGTIHNFGSTPANGDSILAIASGVYNLQWSDPFGASSNDYDLFLVNTAGTVKASSTTVQSGTQNPYESFSPPTLVAGDRLIVFKAASAAVRAIHLNSNRGRLKVATTGQTHGHACAADAFGVAATPATGVPFVSTNTVESFSSDGLRRIFYNANGTAVTPGNVLFSTNGGTIRNKPDITAADGVSTTLPSSTGLNPFFGTSAAAPHAGAIAALLKSASPSLTPAQIRTLLINTALDIQTAGYDNVSGYGIIQAYQAMQSLNPVALPYINLGTTTFSEGTYSNGNGFLEPGELANLVLQLKNSTTTNTNNVSATITTTTPGVTITRGTVAYGTINATSDASNTSLPFTFAINSSVACGATINFLIKISFDGGVNTVGYTASVTLGQLITVASINSTLGGTPPTGANYTVTSGQQTGRLVRGSTASTCAAPVANPGLTVTTGARQYDAYVFTNTTSVSQCYTITLSSSNGLNIYTAAYTSAGFVPSNPSTNYLAEPGQSALTQTYSFTVAAGANFTVVVHDVNVTPASNSPYTLSVTYIGCAARPTCSTVNVTTASIANGATGTPYVQHFTATGGSGSYYYSVSGNIPAGLMLAGDSLYGTPTQAGTFAFTITANDLTGCPSGSANYSLTISGNPPASIVATSGTPQSTGPSSFFATPLSATVYDASNAPLAGIRVIFAAPTSGASGTFTNGTVNDTITTNSSGVATATNFKANATTGSYTVTATVNGLSPVSYSLSNSCSSTFTVTSNADNGPGTLRDILGNACTGYTISFAPSITQITLTSGEIAISKAVTITGPGATILTISGNNNSRIFNIAAGVANTVNISGVTVANGRVPTGTASGGGGIYIASGIVNIARCVITGCDATRATTSDGGGLYNATANTGAVTINQCLISNNICDRLGGGIAQWGTTAQMTINNSTISGNTALGSGGLGYGGGIFFNTLITLSNTTVYQNTASLLGGNIRKNGSNGTLTMGNSILGGGILTSTSGSSSNLSGAFASTGYNIVQTTAATDGYTVSGTTTGNQLGVNPKLFPLANYGGGIATFLPISNSPAINAADPAITTGSDQRGFSRYIGGQADIGAVETNYAGNTSGGTPQSTGVNTQFPIPLQAAVRESGNLIAGDTIVFTAPATGASGTFPGSSATAVVVSDASGIATAPTFTANGMTGTYTVTATLGAALPVLNYSLENTQILPIVFGDMNAHAANCSVQLEWKTLTELNAKDFIVQYSTDGVRYSDLISIASQGNSTSEHTYRYTHTTAAQGMVYYRIRQTDLNGSGIYSKVLTAINNCNKVLIAVYPNPIKDKLTIQLSGTVKQTVLVYDATGRLMAQMSVGSGSHVIDAKGWAKGMYTLTVLQDGKTTYSTQIVRE